MQHTSLRERSFAPVLAADIRYQAGRTVVRFAVADFVLDVALQDQA